MLIASDFAPRRHCQILRAGPSFYLPAIWTCREFSTVHAATPLFQTLMLIRGRSEFSASDRGTNRDLVERNLEFIPNRTLLHGRAP